MFQHVCFISCGVQEGGGKPECMFWLEHDPTKFWTLANGEGSAREF